MRHLNFDPDFRAPRTDELSMLAADLHRRVDRLRRGMVAAATFVLFALLACYALGRIHGKGAAISVPATSTVPAAAAAPVEGPSPASPATPASVAVATEEDTTPKSKAAPPDIVCSSFRLVDDQGRNRVAIGIGDDGAARILVLDTKGHKRLTFHAEATDECSLRIYAADETPRLVMGTAPNGEAGMDITDQAGQTRITLMATEDGDSLIGQADAQETARISHRVAAQGDALSGWLDPEGNFRLVSGFLARAGAFVDLLDTKQQVRARTFASNEGRSGVVHFDAQEKPRMFMGCEVEGWSGVSWTDTLGRLRLMASTLDEECLPPLADLIEAVDRDWSEKNGVK